MVYYNNIPQGTQKPSQMYPQFASNFTDLETVFGVNHITYTATDDRGEHTQVTFNDVIADPGEADPKATLYIKTVAGDSELFFEKYDNGLTANEIRQMTNLTVTNVGSNYGYQTPWGQIFNWGSFACNVADTTVTYAVAFTNPAQSIQLTAVSDNGARNAVVRVSNAANMICRSTNNGLVIYYFAIGV